MEKAAASIQSDTAVISRLEAEVDTLKKENNELRRKLERLYEIMANQQRTIFGQSSEKKHYVLPDDEQLRFFNEAEKEQDVKAPEPTEEVLVEAHKRKKKKTMDEVAEGLPVEKILLAPEEMNCSACGGPLKKIGEKLVRRELEVIPRKVKIVEYYSATYACPTCEKRTGYANIYSIVPPEPLIKHSLASASSIAHVMVQKYADGVPLYRQEKIWKREGVELSRATMANWMIQTAQNWLKPLWRQMKRQLLSQKVIHADETVVQVLKEPGKAASSESRMWVYSSSPHTLNQVRIFEYQPDRSGKHAAAFLKGYSGLLVTDGYSGYNAVQEAVHCGCWAHMRRKWREAMPQGDAAKGSKAAIGYEYCNKLFALERLFEGQLDVQRLEARKSKAEPVMDAYWSWIDKLDPMPGSKLADAVTYARNQKEPLCAFMEHGEIEISNNTAENAIRPFVVGRKNWLFSDTVKGAEASAIIYSVIETAKANEVEPFAYLSYILSRIALLGKTPDAARMELLMPWSSTLKQALLNNRRGDC